MDREEQWVYIKIIVEDNYSLLQLYTQLYVKIITVVYTVVYLPQPYITTLIYIWVYLCIQSLICRDL